LAGREVESQTLLALLAAPFMFGAVLFVVRRGEHRRQSVKQRLQAFATGAPAVDGPDLSLGRPQTKRGGGGFLLFVMLRALRAHLNPALAAAGNRIGVLHLVVTGIIAAMAAVFFSHHIMALHYVVVTMLAAAAGIGVPVLLLRLAQSRFRRRFLGIFPDALDLIARAVRAGLPVFDAMEVAAREIRAPVGTEFRRTLEEVRIGVEVEEALQHTADRIRVPDFRFYVVTLALQRRTGGGLADTLANLSNIIRRRKDLRLKARALTSEAKASAAVLGLLPFVVGGLLYIFNGQLMSILFTDPRGRFVLGLALSSLLVGVAVMVALIKRSLR
jgi:tight adherence protein B